MNNNNNNNINNINNINNNNNNKKMKKNLLLIFIYIISRCTQNITINVYTSYKTF